MGRGGLSGYRPYREQLEFPMPNSIQIVATHPEVPGRIEGFRFFWAYTVTGFKPEKHCQPCFRGRLSPDMNSTNAGTGSFEFNLPDGALLYICGVAAGPVRLRGERNFHLPLAFQEGASGSAHTFNGYQFAFTNAVRIPMPDPVPRAGMKESHYRCANFRVAEKWFGRAAR